MPFKPGQSGNPGGRTKEIREVEKSARQHTNTAIQTLADICANPKAPAPARVSAAVALLNRAWGMPTQPVSGDDASAPIQLIQRVVVDPKAT